MIKIGVYSGKNQASYTQDQFLGFLDDISWRFNFSSVARGSQEILELYVKNESTGTEYLENPYLLLANGSAPRIIWGEISLSTTPGATGGSPVSFTPADQSLHLVTTHMSPAGLEYFFMKVNVHSQADTGASEGPILQLLSVLKGF